MKILSGTSNRSLADSIAGYLNADLCDASVKRFADQEIFAEIHENVRGEDIFLIQSTSFPANDNLMELLVMMDAAMRGSASRITAVVPYFGYARQDRKTSPRSPISAKLVANLMVRAGANRVLTLDLHATQIQGFFDVPTDNMFAGPLFGNDLQTNYVKGGADDLMVVSPDVGGVVRARAVAKRINADLAIIDKRRERAGVSEVMNIIGDVKDKRCILVDDIVDSAGTLCNAAQAIMDAGATSVSAYCTHGVLTGKAIERVTTSPMKELVITNTIEATDAVKEAHNIRQLDVAPLLGEAIRRIANNSSVSSLFD